MSHQIQIMSQRCCDHIYTPEQCTNDTCLGTQFCEIHYKKYMSHLRNLQGLQGSQETVGKDRMKQQVKTAETSGQRRQKPVGKDSRVVFVGWGCLCGMGLSSRDGVVFAEWGSHSNQKCCDKIGTPEQCTNDALRGMPLCEIHYKEHMYPNQKWYSNRRCCDKIGTPEQCSQ